MSGRVVGVAVASSAGARGGRLGTVFYIAAASGGVWKTTNGGVSFEPVFDDAGVGSIGAVATAPTNSNVVWVGTGEANSQRSSSYGDGVYRSLDGGKTFEHMGLRTSQHVGKIVVHPEDEEVVYVAAVGPLWAGGGERGLYRSTDGGESWELILEGANPWTGVTDLVLDPTDPEVMYAATYQRMRRAWSFVGGGPGSGVWKSTDGGESWTELTRGLPASDVGRIGLDVSLSSPHTLYAVVESNEEAGLYRSDDAGASWRRVSDIESIPWYFGEVRVDPTDPETVYHLGVLLQRSRDGGETWERIDRGGVHVDHHAMWINPENPAHIILGNDGGLYVTHDGGETWDWSVDLPISQFYAIGTDMAEPWFGVYGGLQDNNTWGGPSRTRAAEGIFGSDWFVMAGGDGFFAALDPTDPNIAYVESQYGVLYRYDRRTGERKLIRPVPREGEEEFRFNWSAPVHISPWDSNTLYFAAERVFKSPDRGDSWRRISPDLSRGLDPDSLPMMGGIPDDDAVSRHQGTAPFGNIATLDVSEVERGLLAVGTDDGVVAVSPDDGATWTRYLEFPDVPDTAYVSKVRLSAHDPDVLYVTFDDHRSNDFRPYVLRSDDRGESWQSLAGDLPEFGSVRAFAEHPENPDLLFVGTEVAAWVSFDRGATWDRIAEGMPPVRIDDLQVHPRDNALVIGTHGRGIWIVDDLNPLQGLADATARDEPWLFPVRPDLQYTPDPSPSSGNQAHRKYVVPNPPVGTTVWYFLPEDVAAGMEADHEGEGGAADTVAPEAGGPSAADPGGRGLELEILGPDGTVVRTLDAPASAGLHGVHWDFRVDAPWRGPDGEDGADGGAPAVPGRYTARLRVGGVDLEQAVEVEPDSHVTLDAIDLRRLFDIRVEQKRVDARLAMALRQSEQLLSVVDDAREAMAEVEVPPELEARADSVHETIQEVRVRLGAPGAEAPEDEDGAAAPTPVRQLVRIAAGVHRATTLPTEQEREALASAETALAAQTARLDALLQEELPTFFRALDEAGVPWSPGRPLGR
jgi:photosystem II stability/assembly factor-like uncharacterized protein